MHNKTTKFSQAKATYDRCHDILFFDRNPRIEHILREIEDFQTIEKSWDPRHIDEVIQHKKNVRKKVLKKNIGMTFLFPLRSTTTIVGLLAMCGVAFGLTILLTGGLSLAILIPSLLGAYLLSGCLETFLGIYREDAFESSIAVLTTRKKLLSDKNNTTIQAEKNRALEPLQQKMTLVSGLINDHLSKEQAEHQREYKGRVVSVSELYTLSNNELKEMMRLGGQGILFMEQRELTQLSPTDIDEPIARINELFASGSPHRLTKSLIEKIKKAIATGRQPYREEAEGIILEKSQIAYRFAKSNYQSTSSPTYVKRKILPAITSQFIDLVNTYSKNGKNLLISKEQKATILDKVELHLNKSSQIIQEQEKSYKPQKQKSYPYTHYTSAKDRDYTETSKVEKKPHGSNHPTNKGAHPHSSNKKWTTSDNIRSVSQITGIEEDRAANILAKVDKTQDKISRYVEEEVRRENLIRQGIDPKTGKKISRR